MNRTSGSHPSNGSLALRRVIALCVPLLATVVAVWIHDAGSNDVRVILPGRVQGLKVGFDNDSQGGNSTGRVEQTGDAAVPHCNLRAGYSWPYCVLGIPLVDVLTVPGRQRRESVHLWVRQEGRATPQAINLQFRHYDPAYATLKDLAATAPGLVDKGDTLEQGERVAERLLCGLREHAWPTGTRTTCSFGVAAWNADIRLDAAVERADVAMYRAKQAGRDRVVAWRGQ